MTMWGMEFVYHPGRVYLGTDVYEPDFQLDNDVLLEVKGGGNQRLWKALDTERTLGLPVIIGRPGFLPGGSDEEHAGANWEHGEDWAIRLYPHGEGAVFERADVNDPDPMLVWTAPLAYARQLPGIRFFKAVHDSCV